MLCPYCVDEIPAGSTQHAECRMANNRPFPLFYQDYHRGDQADYPIVFSVVGFSGHGKTVYLAALFDYLDHQLTDIWPGFAARVLDQDSLTRLNENRRRLRNGELPGRTAVNFPRPGIMRPSGMPHLTDRTVLVCDPPGEAFTDQAQISELAGFVKRSQCVLFLIDLGALGAATADEMATLLETYLLGLRTMGGSDKRQHLVIVYTKADRMQAVVPGFADLLTRSPELKTWLQVLRPETLANPAEHLRQLQQISNQLLQFTRDDLNASKFSNLAEIHFESVTYTAVTSLGASPEGEGNQQRLKVRMAPRCVIDPFLVMLNKSSHLAPPPPVIKIEAITNPPIWQLLLKKNWILAGIFIVLISLLFYFLAPSAKRQIILKVKQGHIVTPINNSAYDLFLTSNLSNSEHNEILQVITPILQNKGNEVIKQLMKDGYIPPVAECDSTAKIYAWLDMLSPQNSYKARMHYFQGRGAFERKDFKSAQNEFMQSINYEQSLALSVNHMGRIYVKQEDYYTAQNWYQRTIDLDPSWIVPRSNLCILAVEILKNYPLGEQACRGILQVDQNKASGYYYLGRSLEEQNRFCDAMVEFKTAIEKASGSDSPGFNVDKLNQRLPKLANQCGG